MHQIMYNIKLTWQHACNPSRQTESVDLKEINLKITLIEYNQIPLSDSAIQSRFYRASILFEMFILLPNIKWWHSDTVSMNVWHNRILIMESLSANSEQQSHVNPTLDCHNIRQLIASYYLCKLLTANIFAHAIITQLITKSGKQLFDVWVLKATLGRAPNWQDRRSPKLQNHLPKKTWLVLNTDCTIQSETCPLRKWTFVANG